MGELLKLSIASVIIIKQGGALSASRVANPRDDGHLKNHKEECAK